MSVAKFQLAIVLTFYVFSAALAVETIRALKRGARQEAWWMAGCTACMLSVGLAMWFLHERLASRWTPQFVALIIVYVMFYFALKAQRLHLAAPSAFKASMTIIAVGSAVNAGVLIHLFLSPAPRMAFVVIDSLPLPAAMATMLVEIRREEALAKRRGVEYRP